MSIDKDLFDEIVDDIQKELDDDQVRLQRQAIIDKAKKDYAEAERKRKEEMRGPAGKDGKEGKDGKAGPQGPKGDTGPQGPRGPKGEDGRDGRDGQDGLDGKDGVGIEKAYVNENHHLTIKLTSGKIVDAGYVRGKTGLTSKRGGGGNYLGSGASQTVTTDSLGYEFTGGFADRTTGATGTSDVGSNVSYTSADVAAKRWRRFGFSSARQITNDQPYWADSGVKGEAPGVGTTAYEGVGLFSGAYMLPGVTSMFNFTQNDEYNSEVTTGSNPYTAAEGSLDWSQCKVGDLANVRFDFNITPQFANTTVEVGLIFSTRDANDNITYTFPLLTNPIFFGQGSVGKTFLNRPSISAYFASMEDVNARALPAIRADQPVLVQPLTILTTTTR